jgi:hypothetical protein
MRSTCSSGELAAPKRLLQRSRQLALAPQARAQSSDTLHATGRLLPAPAAGWGLDFVWPFLLRYPKQQIAVIDEVCMWHPKHGANKAGSLYSVEAPYE